MRRQRPPPTLQPAAVQLVQCVTGARPGDASFDSYTQYVSAQLYEVGGIGSNRNKYYEQSIIDKRIKGLAEKLSLRGQDDRAQALEEYLRQIRALAPALITATEDGRGGGISSSAASDRDVQNVVTSVLLVLLELSSSPTSVALQQDDPRYEIPKALQRYKQPKVDEAVKNKALWHSILKEEPLVGDHWSVLQDADLDGSDDSDYDQMDLVTMGGRAAGQKLDGESSQQVKGSDTHSTTASVRFSCPSSLTTRDNGADILHNLESLQYWQAGSISKKRQDRAVKGQSQNSTDNQDPRLVNVGLEQLQNIVVTTTLPMEELDLIHETLLMLLGEHSICFERDKHSITPRKGIMLSHLSPLVLYNILSKLSEHGSSLTRIESMAVSTCLRPIQEIGKIVQTFASAVTAIVQEKRQLFSRLQQRYRHSSKGPPQQLLVSLLELFDDVSRQFSQVSELLHFVEGLHLEGYSNQTSCALASSLLSALHDATCQAELSGDRETFDMFRSLLRDSMRPLLYSIESWVNGDRMPDERDFFIKGNPSVDFFSSEYWTSGYNFQADISEGLDARLDTRLLIPSFFRANDLDMILYIGKAVRVMEYSQGLDTSYTRSMDTRFAEVLDTRIFGSRTPLKSGTPSTRPAALTPSMSAILSAQFPLWKRPATSNPQSHLFAVNQSSTIQSPGWEADDVAAANTNFQWLLDREISNAIHEQYVRINMDIHRTMTDKCQLWWHLEGMFSFYLMMNGEVMNDFSHTLFTKVSSSLSISSSSSSTFTKRQAGLDSYSLGSMFSNVAEQHRWPMRAFATVRHNHAVEIQRSSRSMHPMLGQLEDVEFEYMLPWPLSGFIYSSAANKPMLQRISVFLLQIKVAKHAIEQAAFLYARPLPSPTTRMFWKLRLHLLGVVNDMCAYCMTTVLDEQRKDFEKELKKKGASLELDDLVRFSTAFVRTSHERLFLGDKAVALLRSFKAILELTLDFAKLMTRYLAMQDQKRMQIMEDGDQGGTWQQQQRPYPSEDASSTRCHVPHPGNNVQQQAETGVFRRRVSFGASRILRHTAAMAESDEDDDNDEEGQDDGDEDAEMDEGSNSNSIDGSSHAVHEKRSHDDKEGRHLLEHAHEDIEMAEVPGRVPRSKSKKQKTSLTSARGPPKAHYDPSQQHHDILQRTASAMGQDEDMYFMTTLQEFEQDLQRRKRFLADNLKIIVQSNIAKMSSRLGDSMTGGGHDDNATFSRESGSSYLYGLIYALAK